MNRIIVILAVAALSVGCSAARKDFLRAEDGKIVNDGGQVLLRGFGLGGWVLQEPYMLRLVGGIATQTQFRDSLVSLVGEERTAEFYRRWWCNGIQKRDIDSLAAWGFNHVRMPMHYNIYTLPIEKEPVSGEQTWLEEGFELTDNLLEWCAANRIYLFLDLHATPGGQGNDVAISDAAPVKFWQDERNVEKAIALWCKLAERYKDEEWLGGYDLINEPNWGFTDPADRNGTAEQDNAPLKKFLVDATKAIRRIDKDHLIIIEGNGWGNNYNGIFPLDWDDNTAISFHKYWNYNDSESLAGALQMRREQGAPLWMSESGENSNAWFTDAISLLESNDIGWCWWTYKRLGLGTPMEIIPGDGYLRILDYWAGRAPRPSADEAWAALEILAENYKQENTVFHRDYIDAMFRQVATTETEPWIRHHLSAEGCTIFAADYDLGREGYAYHDLDVANYRSSNPAEQGGNAGRVYRNDGVDIFAGDAPNGNGYYVGRTGQGEWLKYTLDVETAGDYTLTVCEAPEGTGKWRERREGTVVLEAGRTPFVYHIAKPGTDIAWLRLEAVK